MNNEQIFSIADKLLKKKGAKGLSDDEVEAYNSGVSDLVSKLTAGEFEDFGNYIDGAYRC